MLCSNERSCILTQTCMQVKAAILFTCIWPFVTTWLERVKLSKFEIRLVYLSKGTKTSYYNASFPFKWQFHQNQTHYFSVNSTNTMFLNFWLILYSYLCSIFWLMIMMVMVMNCFCGMVDRRKAFSLISS